MNLSRAKAANIGPAQEVAGQKKEKPLDFQDFLEKRDYAGALAILEFNKRTAEGEELKETLQWIGYTAFHLGDMKKALETYQELLSFGDRDPLDHVYLGCATRRAFTPSQPSRPHAARTRPPPPWPSSRRP